jgi:GT2 family glycosyltransferase
MNGTLVIVTYERLAATRRCIEAVLESQSRPRRIVIVDNASRSEVRDYLEGVPADKFWLDRNVGLYRALNIGVEATSDELVAFLDCDIVVRDGWWDALSAEVTSDDAIGLAGSRYLNADGTLQEGYPVLSPDGWYGRNLEDRREPADCQYIAIGCSVFRRSCWKRVGGFDERYFISHGDIDFCYKVRYEAEMRVRYCPHSSVIHDHEYGKERSYEATRFNETTVTADSNRFRTKWHARYSLEALSHS